jgi:predicted dehydrogenase
MPHQVERRDFLASIAGSAAAFAASSVWSAKSYANIVGANDRIRVGQIGVGGMGLNHSNCLRDLSASNNLEVVSVADCWLTRAQAAANIVGASNAYSDYRRVLDDDIDYVTIATPEHHHRVMTWDALDAGKAVYCEKPMTHTIEEGLAVIKKQRLTSLPVQIGVQATSDDIYRSARDAIRKGVLGRVVQAQIEYVRRNGEQGPWRNPDVVKQHLTKPADLDWKAWLGQADPCEWNPHHYFEWRNYSAYSGGIATDLFIHRITRMMIALDLGYPRRVVGMGGIWQWPDGRDLPDNFEMICEYPRGLTLYVLGTQSNRVGLDHLIRGYRGTMKFVGEKWIVENKDGEQLAEGTGDVRESIHKHHSNLHDHLRNGAPLNCPVDLGMAGVVAVCMANESWRTGQMMAWDQGNEQMVPANTLPVQNHFPAASDGEERTAPRS